MKVLLCLPIAILVFSTLAISQNVKQIKVESNEIIDMSPDQSWEIINDWENLNQLVPEIVESTLVTGEGIDSYWTIKLINGGTIKEEMVYFNLSDKTMSYIMTETPMPIQDYTAIIKVETYGISKSLVSFYTECKASSKDYENIENTFKSFQITYLSNLKRRNNE